jgi:geranylgeranyl diphosphate synthase, type I
MANVSPSAIDPFKAATNQILTDFIETNSQQLLEISSEFQSVKNELLEFLQGGKRLRPAFAAAGYQVQGDAVPDSALRAFASLELIQASALIHDDLMDDSAERRGRATVHKLFSQLHKSAGWQGAPSQFGASAALLLGNLCLVWADQLYFESGHAESDLLRAKPIFDDLRVEVMAGQYLDLLEQARRTAEVTEIKNIVLHKTAKYTVERPLHLGATLVGASAKQLSTLSEYGLAIGEAFQYRDDLLGTFGDSSVTGKPVGGDIREGKRTLLVALLHEKASPTHWNEFDAILGNQQATEAQVNRATEILTQYKVADEVEKTIQSLLDIAMLACESPEISSTTQSQLQALGHAAANRSR